MRGACARPCSYLGLTDVSHADVSAGGGSSLAVLSLSSDPKALALGPQLAVFAASLGIPTALVIGPQQDANATATLRAACAAPPTVPSGRSRQSAGHRQRSRQRRPAARRRADRRRRRRRRPDSAGR